MRWDVLAHVYWLLPKSAAELRYVCYGSMVQGPKRVFVERLDPVAQANFNAVGQKVILPKQILLLDASKELRIVSLSNRHAAPFLGVQQNRL
jgi:hypothetical protein